MKYLSTRQLRLRRRRGVARDQVGAFRIILVEQLAHQNAPLLPPLIQIDQGRGVLRRRQDQLFGLVRFFVFAQPLRARENVAGVAARGGRHLVEQHLGVVEVLDHRRARLGERELVAAQALGLAHAGFDVVQVEALLHAHLVVGAREHVAVQFEHLVLDIGAGVLALPGVAHQRGGAGAVAFGEQRMRHHVAALGGGRRMAGEEGEHGVVGHVIVPQRVLGAAAEQRHVRPIRVGGDEGGVALEARIGVVGAQDHPFGKLAGDRVDDGVLGGIGIRFAALAGGLDHPFELLDIGRRGGGDGGDGEGSGDRADDRLEAGAGGKQRAAQADIDLGIGRQVGAGQRPLARQWDAGGERGRCCRRFGRRLRGRLGRRRGRGIRRQLGCWLGCQSGGRKRLRWNFDGLGHGKAAR